MSASDLSDALDRIRRRFLVRLADQYEMSRTLTDDWLNEKDDVAPLEEFCAIAHKIAGLAKSVGFSELGAAAFEADTAIQKWLNDRDDATLEQKVTEATSEFMKVCETVLSDNKDG